ncbi:MAG: 3-deoxy-D-manno-octulosonic acid kinase [Pseudomonadota bacterium]|nr:3-deoxy-D-manno-octulosonic acid kinase [Pseudomonadota bacterium]
MARQLEKLGRKTIVYDDSLLNQINFDMFDPEFWSESKVVPGYSGGRGPAYYIRHENDDWVLKHYHRGGLVGRIIQDGFFWAGQDNCRSVIEFDLLAEIIGLGLPAPVPVAAQIERSGLKYSADLITQLIPDVIPLSNRLASGSFSDEIWSNVGKCIANFHIHGFYHADLSAHNLQINTEGKIYLLDWDRGRKMVPGKWRQKNLDRLRRSFIKISLNQDIRFSLDKWDLLLQGYFSVESS